MAKKIADAKASKSSTRKGSAKAEKSSTPTTAKAVEKPTAVVSPKEKDLNALVAKATKLNETVNSAKAEFETASSNLTVARYKSERLAVEICNFKHQNGFSLTTVENVVWSLNRVETFALQNGLNKVYDLVQAKFKELSTQLGEAKKQSRSLNSAIRNLLADWTVWEPIFKSVGLKKSEIKASLLNEATPFLTLPTGEGIKVCAVTRRVKRDGKGNPLKVDGKKQYEPTLRPIVDWDAITFATTVLTVELSKGVFSAEAESKHREFLLSAEEALKDLAKAKADAKAAKAAERKAKAEAKASKVAEEVASKEAVAEANRVASKEANKKAKQIAKATASTAKAVDTATAKAVGKLQKPQAVATKVAKGKKTA